MTGGSGRRILWGDWGEAMTLRMTYAHPRTGTRVEIRQAVRIPKSMPLELRLGQRAEIVCRGVMLSGMLRHPLFLRWVE